MPRCAGGEFTAEKKKKRVYYTKSLEKKKKNSSNFLLQKRVCRVSAPYLHPSRPYVLNLKKKFFLINNRTGASRCRDFRVHVALARHPNLNCPRSVPAAGGRATAHTFLAVRARAGRFYQGCPAHAVSVELR